MRSMISIFCAATFLLAGCSGDNGKDGNGVTSESDGHVTGNGRAETDSGVSVGNRRSTEDADQQQRAASQNSREPAIVPDPGPGFVKQKEGPNPQPTDKINPGEKPDQ